MSHEMPAAGYGFLWPLVTFESDGEEVSAVCRPSNPLLDEPVRYLADFRESVSAWSFEKTLDRFMDLVLARLDALGISGTHLHELWDEVREERADPVLSGSRKVEARLGFEPDEAPEHLMQRMSALSQKAGYAAVDEIAPVCAGSQPSQTLEQIEQFSAAPGTEARISLSGLFTAGEFTSAAPWEKGWRLAQKARIVCGFGTPRMSDQELSSLLDIPTEALQKADAATPRPPLGLAIRNCREDHLKLLFRKRNRPALRFEAARFLAEHILTPRPESWLPATDTSTARQKIQRAFAAEFLCPIGGLRDFLGGDFSPEAIEEAGEYFGVSELAVKSHLANHRQIPFDSVTV
jgi:hypothetical protein